MDKLLSIDSKCYDIKIIIRYTKKSSIIENGFRFNIKEKKQAIYSLVYYEEKAIKKIHDTYKDIVEELEISFKCSIR